MSRVEAVLSLAGGSGRIVRRREAVLFVPTTDPTLVAAFDGADEGGELQALASATVAAGFAVAGFVALSWQGRTARVMVLGDVAVETDQPSLPMLTGAGSRTWVEHSLVLDATAVVTVGADADVQDDTRLDQGLALAGGFRLHLDPADEPATAEPPTFEEAVVDRSPTGPVMRPAPTPPFVDPTDPDAALNAILAAAMNDEGRPLSADEPSAMAAAPAPDEARPPPVSDPDVTLAPPDVAAVRAEIEGGPDSLVDAKLCSRQHPNPPSAAACAICRELLAPGAASMVHVPQPVLGALLLDDGTRIDLDADLLLGRNPGRDGDPDEADHRPIRVPGDKVSRRHLEVRRHGWDVIVTDLGSTNGSFVVPHPGGPVLALERGRPQLVEPEATVYFGSRSFTVVGRESGGAG